MPKDYQAPLVRDWPWTTIRAALLQRGLSVDELAVRAGYARASGRAVKRQAMPKVQTEIARALGYAPMAIWPTRYTEAGRALTNKEWLERMAMARADQTMIMPVVVP